MSRIFNVSFSSAAIIVLMGFPALAGKMPMAPYEGSQDFERIKALAGAWEGTHMVDDKKENVEVEYSVTAQGSTVMEVLFPGTPNEMISVYTEKNGKPFMTHYCAIGNQPQMEMVYSDQDKIVFDFVEGNRIDPAVDSHMHALTLSIDGQDHLVHEWVMYDQGQQIAKTVFDFHRLGTPEPDTLLSPSTELSKALCSQSVPCHGNCEAAFPRVYFNHENNRCESAYFSGCGCGFVFKDLEECQKVCE